MESDKIFSASSRFRPYETISFDPPIEGTNGAKLLSYTWAYEWKEEFNPKIGEDVARRISDWSQAEISADTGKGIVHQFTIKTPDGEVKTVSSESVLILLGYTEREKLKSFPSLVGAIKTLAKQKMKLSVLEAQEKEYDEALKKFTEMPKPPIIEEKYYEGEHGGRTVYRMGETTVWQIDKTIYNPDLGKSEYVKLPSIEPERKDCLIDSWIREQIQSLGIKKPYGIYDLKNRIVRQERRVKELSKETSEETKQFKNGGNVEDWDFGRIKEGTRIRTTPTHFGKWDYKYGTALSYRYNDNTTGAGTSKYAPSIYGAGEKENIWTVRWDDGKVTEIKQSLIEKAPIVNKDSTPTVNTAPKSQKLEEKTNEKIYFIAKENVQSFPDARKLYFTEGQRYLVSGNYLPDYAYIIDNFNKEHLITQEWMHKFDIVYGDISDNKNKFIEGLHYTKEKNERYLILDKKGNVLYKLKTITTVNNTIKWLTTANLTRKVVLHKEFDLVDLKTGVTTKYKWIDKPINGKFSGFYSSKLDDKQKESHLAPNGKPSSLTPEQYKLVRTPAFKKWFGDWENDKKNSSKIVDENGEPKVVYRGNTTDRHVLRTREYNPRNVSFRGRSYEWNEFGAFFTDNPKIAEFYAERSTEKGFVKQYFLNIRNPKIEHLYVDRDWADVIPKMFDNKYETTNINDGFVIENIEEVDGQPPATTYNIKDPSQAKLASGENTTFDPNMDDTRFEKGGNVNSEEHKQTYKKWKSLVNMSKSELEKFYNSEEGKEAGLSLSEAKKEGIDSGRESSRWIMKMKDTPVSEWTPSMWRWANKQISFISRMSGNQGGLYDEKGNKTRKHTSLLIWGHNPKKKEDGGIVFADGGEVSAHTSELELFLSQKSALETEQKELWEKEKTLPYGEEKNQSSNRRSVISFQLKQLEPKILNARNKVKAIENGGSLDLVVDKKGGEHHNIPNFTKTNTENFIFDVDTILTDPIPPYIPFINEEEFRLKGYVFDVIRIDRDKYILACNGYNHRQVTTKLTELGAEFDPSGIHCFVLVTLDQLVLTNDYYFTKAKAVLQKEADDKNRRGEEYYDKLPLQKRQDFFDKNVHYRGLPANVKKKVTEEIWSALPLDEKEKLYKPIKHYGAKRISSKLEETQMWLSFAEMYRLFINPEAIPPKKGYEGEEVFGYWRAFRDMMKWKINDIYVQREQQSELRKVALETSFGESNTNPILQKRLGILVKRQDGSQIKPAEIEQIEEAWLSVEKVFGSLREQAEKDGLKISHTGQKYVFASKAAGMFIPSMKTIAVSAKFGAEQFNQILSHELGHYIDSINANNGRFASDDFESTAGILASTFRKLMNEKTDSKYINASKECLARAMEMHYAVMTYGDSAMLTFTNHPLETPRPYFAEESYVSKENYYNEIKPLCEKFIQEYLK